MNSYNFKTNSTGVGKCLSVATASLVAITVLSAMVQSGLIGSSGNASAESTATAKATISVGDACSFTANVTSDHHATLTPGVYSGTYNNGSTTPYANGIGSTTLTTICNDNAGYAIYAVGYTGDTTTAPGNTNLVGTSTNTAIVTGTATSGGTSNWAMKLAKVTDANESYNPTNLTIVNGFDDFHAVPSTYTKVANYASSTDAAKGSKITATYAAYIQSSQVADTYVGQVKYTLVHPNTNDPSSFMVNFRANGGTGIMASQKITRGQTTALISNAFTAPAGKTFSGWNTAVDGSGTSYTNGQQVTNLADAGATITLYAQWGVMETNQSSCTSSPMISTVAAGINYMQDINGTNKTTVLASLTPDTTYQIKDSRDNTTYCVSKLKDGNLWLLDNLALDLTTVDLATLKGQTNASDTSLEYLKGVLSRDPLSDKNGKYATGAVSTEWDGTNPHSDPRIETLHISTSAGVRAWKYGIYYNYCAASAGSYCYGSGESVGTSTGDATEDICPAGWTMPSGGPSGDYNGLYTGGYGYGDAYNYRLALHLPTSGYFGGNGIIYDQEIGSWWSTTRRASRSMYTITAEGLGGTLTDSNVNTTQNSSRVFGLSVRCLLRF